MNLFIPHDKKQKRKKQPKISKETESLHYDQVNLQIIVNPHESNVPKSHKSCRSKGID